MAHVVKMKELPVLFSGENWSLSHLNAPKLLPCCWGLGRLKIDLIPVIIIHVHCTYSLEWELITSLIDVCQALE